VCDSCQQHRVSDRHACFQGKSSKSKKLNETDEERAARLEAEAAAAQEGARRREEAARYACSYCSIYSLQAFRLVPCRLYVSSAHHVLIFHFSIARIFCLPLVHRLRLVERQQKEQAYGHMNAVKIHNQWRRIMRMAKTEELKQDIEILSQSYDRTVDRKDALIQVHRQLQLHTRSIHIYLAHCNAYSCPPLWNLMCIPKLIVHHMHVNAVITNLHVGTGQGS